MRRRQLLAEAVEQFAAADLALEGLVAAVEVLALLGVDEAGSAWRREDSTLASDAELGRPSIVIT